MVFYSLPDESSSPTYTVHFFDVDVSFHCGAAPTILFLEPGCRPRLCPYRLANRTLLSSTVKHVWLLWPSAMPHFWHFLLIFLAPFAPNHYNTCHLLWHFLYVAMPWIYVTFWSLWHLHDKNYFVTYHAWHYMFYDVS
jgi:hypothetical protein